jgi:hypothetical protein
VFIKPGVVAGKLITLVTEINPHFLVTGPHTAVFENPALFIPAAVTVFCRKIIKHFFKIGVLPEHRRLEHGFKPAGSGPEIAQFLFELNAQFSDISLDMGKTGFTAQAAWGDNGFNGVGCHDAPPLCDRFLACFCFNHCRHKTKVA